ncbi:Ionotropic receptor 123 [Blattella germanica]|nr:Ionotropic receptor 123 [Blattella germanica]
MRRRIMYKYEVIIYCLCLCFGGVCSGLSDQADLIAALKLHLRFGCIFFLGADYLDLLQREKVSREVKFLSMHQIATTLLQNTHMVKCLRNKNIFIMSATEDSVSTFLHKFSFTKNMSDSAWLLFLNSDADLDIIFSKVDIPFNCEFLVAQTQTDYVRLTEVYRVNQSLPLQKQYFGSWSSRKGLNVHAGGMYTRRNDLQGILLRAGVMDDDYTAVLEEKDGKPIKLRGFGYEAWKVLQNRLNFTTEFIKPEDCQYGVMEDDGNWNGLIGQILRNETDVSITPLIWNKQRNEVVTFIASMFKINLVLAVKTHDSSDIIWDNFLLPFSSGLWTSIIITILVTGFLLLFIEKIWNHHIREPIWKGTVSSLSEALLTTFGAFCFQGHCKTPTCLSSRIMFLFIHITSVVVLCSYSGSLISKIATQVFSLPFNDLEGFSKDGTYQLGVLRASGDLTYFKESNNSMIKNIYDKFIAPYKSSSLLSSYLGGLTRACSQSKFAFVFGDDKFTSLNSLKCSLSYLPIMQYDMSFLMRKHSLYKDLLSHSVHQMYESGIIRILLHLYTPERYIKTSNDFSPVSINQITPVFVILVSGIAFAMLLFLGERTLRLFMHYEYHKNSQEILQNFCLKNTMKRHSPWQNTNFTNNTVTIQSTYIEYY